MKIVCISIGRKHSDVFVPAITEYEKRLKAYVDFEFMLIPPSDKETESKLIIKKLKASDEIILLDERGSPIDNHKLSSLIDKRLILIEQLYRSYTILAGQKYHHS